jgi:hypothetical protein
MPQGTPKKQPANQLQPLVCRAVSERPPAPEYGVWCFTVAGHHGRMDMPKQPTPPQPQPQQTDAAMKAKVAQWLELKREMEALYAQVEYARLLLKLGVLK